MPHLIHNNGDAAQQLATAMESGETQSIASALMDYQNDIVESVRADFDAYQASHDSAVLAQRGIRQLTGEERSFYEGLTSAMKSATPKQAFADFINTTNGMPETIIEDVFKNLEQEHKLLQFINFEYVGYTTKRLVNKHKVALAAWGKITAAITAEIDAALEVVTMNQNRLTAYAVIPLDILDMGYEWVDALIRRTMAEAIYDGLEDGIVNGAGSVKDQPIGLIRDIHHGVTVNESTGYPAKTAVALTNLGTDYMAKVATMAKTEKWTEDDDTFGGKGRKISKIGFIANTKTMLTKVDPARLFVGPAGYYLGDPTVATEFIPCEAVADNYAVLLVEGGYTLAVGGKRNEAIQFSDDFKFLEDARTFKTMQHADGRADDNTAALYVNLTNLEREALPVKEEA